MRKWIKLLACSPVVVLFAGCQQGSMRMSNAELREKANRLAQKYILVDTHLDTPWRLAKKMEDISIRAEGGCFDYPRARAGGLDAVFMAAYVPPEYEQDGGAKALAEERIEMIKGLAKKHPEKFIMAKSTSDVSAQFNDERVSLLIAIENGSALEGDIENVKHFYDLGTRYITLVHAENNAICDSSYTRYRKWNGLSPVGKEVVAEMNRLGMMVDVSHVSDETFYQVIELSKAPVVATHSSCRHFTPDMERNMSDEMIQHLAKKGGLIQINFGAMFLDAEISKKYLKRWDIVKAHVKEHDLDDAAKEEFKKQYDRDHPIENGDISMVVAHIDHVVKLVGAEYVGLGSDFDGVGNALPQGLEDVSCYPNLIYELLKKGYSDSDIEKICSGNILRVWTEIERIGREN